MNLCCWQYITWRLSWKLQTSLGGENRRETSFFCVISAGENVCSVDKKNYSWRKRYEFICWYSDLWGTTPTLMKYFVETKDPVIEGYCYGITDQNSFTNRQGEAICRWWSDTQVVLLTRATQRHLRIVHRVSAENIYGKWTNNEIGLLVDKVDRMKYPIKRQRNNF